MLIYNSKKYHVAKVGMYLHITEVETSFTKKLGDEQEKTDFLADMHDLAAKYDDDTHYEAAIDRLCGDWIRIA